MNVGVRSCGSVDIAFIAGLYNKARHGSYEFVPFNVETLQKSIQEKKLRILIAEIDGQIVGSAACRSSSRGEEIEWLLTAEGPDRRAMEDTLVEEIEKRAASDTITASVDSESMEIGEWVRRGYAPQGGMYQMIAGLDRPRPVPPALPGTTMCSLAPERVQEFIEMVNEGFGRKRLEEDAVRRWKTELPSFSEDWIHVAQSEGKIVSVVVAKPDVKYNSQYRGRRGYLGPAATLSEHRGKGFASVLTCRAMNFLLEKGMDSVSLHTSELNVPSLTLLKKIGFRAAHNWKFLRKNLSQTRSQIVDTDSKM